jgi:queuine/archaeosine tRNA-ribosyltransferase
MTLPLFGVDSFSRWVVPPPPVPVTREKINFWEPANWGVMRLKEYEDTYGEKLACKCALCAESGSNVEKFLEGDPRLLLAKAKTHDHYAQRAELEKSQDKIREGKFGEYVRKKRFAREFADAMKEMPKDA